MTNPRFRNSFPRSIGFLADNPQYVDTLGRWFYDEWKPYYCNRTLLDVTESIRARAQKQIPFALVAIDSEGLLGTVSLKHDDLEGVEYSPWLAGLYVRKDSREKGVGTQLVHTCLDQAKHLGLRRVFLWTPSARAFFERLGWRQVAERDHCGTVITIMVFDL